MHPWQLTGRAYSRRKRALYRYEMRTRFMSSGGNVMIMLFVLVARRHVFCHSRTACRVMELRQAYAEGSASRLPTAMLARGANLRVLRGSQRSSKPGVTSCASAPVAAIQRIVNQAMPLENAVYQQAG